MKRITAVIALFISIVFSCKNKDAFVINGGLDNAKDLKLVKIYQRDKLVDSAILNSDGKFKFEVASPDAEFYYIAAGEKNYLLVAKNGDELDFKADLLNVVGDYEIEGSDDAEQIKEFNTISNKYTQLLQGIQEEFKTKVSQSPALKDSLEKVLIPKYEQTLKALSTEAQAFAKKNQDNLAGFYAIRTLDPSVYETELIAYSDAIKGKFPNNTDVKDFNNKMAQSKTLAVGQIAPDFQMPSPDGTNVKLSQFKGKYVLLDFWASWCAPCRQENPNLVKQFNAFKDKGFTIFSVSLDDSRDKWLNAIKADKLTWNHASELKQWDSNIVAQYQLSAVPSSLLLDKQGKILAKNLRGKELEDFLSKTLN